MAKNIYRMTDADMKQLRAEFPGVKWRRSVTDGGADATVEPRGYRIWCTREQPYSDDRGGWQFQVMESDFLVVHDDLVSATFAEACKQLRAFAAGFEEADYNRGSFAALIVKGG